MWYKLRVQANAKLANVNVTQNSERCIRMKIQQFKDITTSLQISSKIYDQKNQIVYRRWSYPLCDYKLNQIFWTSEPSPIMDDISFCRNMLKLVLFFDKTLERSVGVLVSQPKGYHTNQDQNVVCNPAKVLFRVLQSFF